MDARFEPDSPVFAPRRRRPRERANVHFYIDPAVWLQVKLAAREAGMSQGQFAEQAFLFALQHLGD